MFKTNSNQLGRSMVEMLGVLAIIGVLSVGGISGLSKAMNTYKTNKIITQMSEIIANVKTVAMRKKSIYRDLTVKGAVKMKLIPEELIETYGNNPTLKNIYNGEVRLGSGKDVIGSSKDSLNFAVYMGGLPKETCMSLATKSWGDRKIVVIASNSANIDGGNLFANYGYSDTQVCQKKSGTALCANKIMSPDIAASGCSCTSNTCSFAVVTY